ncbi:hypothetical protein [Saccharophagus degradans]|uniref:Solute-binding protein family 3/N-terminal domain-containing protein n=1 Tax=Saccharophagus degradans TaxID=86304 RepID=A0AAW7X837_9GAMM|nr:hypothetical protein [Saccharophagus degradans]MDO6423782.1 hypothetical protein [Saccharophagus degradans]MDO6607862.1 hypothetical protein [Saccharophagus degradans]
MYFKVICFLLAFNMCQFAYAETLRVGVASDLVTFRYFSMGKVECAFKLAGYDLDVIELPIERNYQSVQAGVIDVDLLRVEAAVKSAKNIVPIPTPMFSVEKWIYYRHKGSKVTPENMKSHALIPIIGVHYYDKYKKQGYPMLNSVVALDSAFKMLNAGRGDYVLWTQDGKEIVTSLGLEEFIGQVQLGKPEPLYTVLNERHKDKIPQLNLAYERVFVRNDCPFND